MTTVAETIGSLDTNESIMGTLLECYGEGENTDWPYLTDLVLLIVSLIEKHTVALGIPPDMDVDTLRRAIALVAWVDSDEAVEWFSFWDEPFTDEWRFVDHLRSIGATPDTGDE